MKIRKQYAPDPAEAGGGASDTLDPIKNEKPAVQVPGSEAKPPADKPASSDNPEDHFSDWKLDDEKKQEEPKNPDEKPAEKKLADEKKDDAKPADEKKDDSLSADDDDDVLPAVESKVEEDTEEEATWSGIGKELGFEKPTETFEDIKTSFTEKIESVKTTSFEEGKKIGQQISLAEYGPEAQKFFEFLASDPTKTVADYLNPLKKFDDAIAMESENLVKETLIARGLSEEKALERIGVIKERGDLEFEADSIRASLKDLRTKEESDILNAGQTAYKAMQDKIIAEKQKEDNAILSAFTEVKEVFGIKTNKEHIENLQKRWKEGEFRERIKSDPKYVAKAIALMEFGEAAKKKIEDKAFNGGRDIAKEKLHNIKKIDNGSGVRAAATERGDNKETDDHFDGWKLPPANGN